MKIASNLNETERINFLKENKKEIIFLIKSLGGNLKESMDALLQSIDNSNFYDFCDISTMSFDVEKRIEEITSAQCKTFDVTEVERQNYFDNQREIQKRLLY
jgi:hypothetical protein